MNKTEVYFFNDEWYGSFDGQLKPLGCDKNGMPLKCRDEAKELFKELLTEERIKNA